jgi:uncharacterized protein
MAHFTHVIALFLSVVLTILAASHQAPLVSDPAQAQEPAKRAALSPSEISELRTKAVAGDAIAQTALGRAYRTGDGVPHSDQTAAEWFRKAADQGNADAENSLGTMYAFGDGVERNKENAVSWYRKAAKHGSGAAMFNLGAAYYNGDGVDIDDDASCAWFLLAQEAGYAAADEAVSRATFENAKVPIRAFEKIGAMYASGAELPKNASAALKWYRRAADDGSREASVAVASILAAGPHPTEEEFAEARRRCEQAANHSYAPAAYCMALIYRRGLGVAKDPIETAKWLARAADLGHAQATLQLGEAYWKGDGVKPDLVTAYMWIWLAYNSKLAGAGEDEEAIRKQMNPKDIDKAKRRAGDWVNSHRLVLGVAPARPSAPK